VQPGPPDGRSDAKHCPRGLRLQRSGHLRERGRCWLRLLARDPVVGPRPLWARSRSQHRPRSLV